MGSYIEQLDVKTAFLNDQIESEVYLYPPDGVKIGEGKLLKLKAYMV